MRRIIDNLGIPNNDGTLSAAFDVPPGLTHPVWIGSDWVSKPERYAERQALITREALKADREQAVAAITVTTAAGHTFDGDEISQGRMARAVLALSTGLSPSVNWVLADNSVIDATAAELTEALVLAGQAQAAIWVIN